MSMRIGSFIATSFVFGLAVGFFVDRPHLGTRGSGIQEACTEMAGVVSVKCHEADRWHALFDQKYPNSANNTEALKSKEWERATSWSQACDDAKQQLEEALLAAPEPAQKGSTKGP